MAQPAKGPYFLVIIHENADTEMRCFASPEALASCLRGLPQTAQGYAFHGERLHVTSAPWRFLVHGDKHVPLFDEPKPGKVDATGWLGFGEQNAKEGGADDKYKQLLAEADPAVEEEDADDFDA